MYFLIKNISAGPVMSGTISSGGIEDIQERIEELLQEKLRIPIKLDVQTKDGFMAFLHEFNEYNLTNEELDYLDTHYGLNTHDPENAWHIIQRLLEIGVGESA